MSKRTRKRLERNVEVELNVTDSRTLVKNFLALCKELKELKDELREVKAYIKRQQKARTDRLEACKVVIKSVGFPIVVGVIMFLVGHFWK